MIIAAFLMSLVVTTMMTNKKNDTATTDESLEFNTASSVQIFLCMVSSFLFQWISSLFSGNFRTVFALVMFGVYLCLMMVINITREKRLKERQDQIIRVYEALSDIFGRISREDMDFGKTPFSFEMDKKSGLINIITIDMASQDAKINDNSIIYAQYSLNKFFPEFDWISDLDAPNRQLKYQGIPKPPKMAKFPATDYRPSGWIPLGVAGSADGVVEVGWNISDPKDLGQSMYFDEEGHQAGTLELPSAPQCMTLGSTGGGKAIYVDQEIEILDE